MSQFTSFDSSAQIDSFQALFVREENGGIRPAKIINARASGTGLTLTGPFWAEEGAFWGWRTDVLRFSSEARLDEWLEAKFGFSFRPESLVAFEEHGTDPRNLWLVNLEALREEIRAWVDWRAYHWGASKVPPLKGTLESRLAQRGTRDGYVRYPLTAGEALKGLAMRSGGCYEPILRVSDTPDEGGDLEWVIWSVHGRATGFAKPGQTPTYFDFERSWREAWTYEGIDWYREIRPVLENGRIVGMRYEWSRRPTNTWDPLEYGYSDDWETRPTEWATR